LIVFASIFLAASYPRGDSTLPFGYGFPVAVGLGTCFLIGRWWSLLTLALPIAVVVASGAETQPLNDQPLWVYLLAFFVVLAVPAGLLGIVGRRLFDRFLSEMSR
jgi:hypothetical protein